MKKKRLILSERLTEKGAKKESKTKNKGKKVSKERGPLKKRFERVSE